MTPVTLFISALLATSVLMFVFRNKRSTDAKEAALASARDYGWTEIEFLNESIETKRTWPWKDKYVTVFYVGFKDHAGRPRRSMCRVDSDGVNWEA